MSRTRKETEEWSKQHRTAMMMAVGASVAIVVTACPSYVLAPAMAARGVEQVAGLRLLLLLLPPPVLLSSAMSWMPVVRWPVRAQSPVTVVTAVGCDVRATRSVTRHESDECHSDRRHLRPCEDG